MTPDGLSVSDANSQYFACVANLPRPSDMQIDAFVEYFASAHSWYKHLPLLPPGQPFLFFLNPHAGREWIKTEQGGAYRDRTTETPARDRFHYTWQPTRDYIDRFGYLDYFEDAGTAFLVPMREGILDTQLHPRVQGPTGEWIDLPGNLRAAGCVSLTAVIHPIGQDPHLWLVRLGKVRNPVWRPDTVLPKQSPDDETAATVLNLIRRIPDQTGLWRGLWHRLLQSEERLLELSAYKELKTTWLPAYAGRQREQVGQCIRQMLRCIYDHTAAGSQTIEQIHAEPR